MRTFKRSESRPAGVRCLAVRTEDFRLAYRLLAELKRRGVPCLQLQPGAALPADVAAWFASPSEVHADPDGCGIPTTLDSVDIAVDRALHRIEASDTVSELCIGVDPGPRPGIAWLGDGTVLGRGQLESVDDTVVRIQRIIDAIEHGSVVIRVGDGSPTITNRIINLCLARGLPVERVDEQRTSRGVSRHQHSSAAMRIARLDGVRQSERLPVRPTEGEVREIQRRSRRASEGRTTIPSSLARAVAVGRLSMAEAIDHHSPLGLD